MKTQVGNIFTLNLDTPKTIHAANLLNDVTHKSIQLTVLSQLMDFEAETDCVKINFKSVYDQTDDYLMTGVVSPQMLREIHYTIGSRLKDAIVQFLQMRREGDVMNISFSYLTHTVLVVMTAVYKGA